MSSQIPTAPTFATFLKRHGLQEFLHYFPTDFTVGQFRSLTEEDLHLKYGIKNPLARQKFMAVLARTSRKPRDHAMRTSVGSMTPVMSPIGPPCNPGVLGIQHGFGHPLPAPPVLSPLPLSPAQVLALVEADVSPLPSPSNPLGPGFPHRSASIHSLSAGIVIPPIQGANMSSPVSGGQTAALRLNRQLSWGAADAHAHGLLHRSPHSGRSRRFSGHYLSPPVGGGSVSNIVSSMGLQVGYSGGGLLRHGHSTSNLHFSSTGDNANANVFSESNLVRMRNTSRGHSAPCLTSIGRNDLSLSPPFSSSFSSARKHR
jgi:hypothetical protein